MKNTFKLFVTLFVFALVLSQSSIKAQDIPPTFNMTVKNIATTNPSNPDRDSILRFEVWLQQTNQGQPNVMDFEYCCGQFTWSYNTEINGNSNGGRGGNLVFGIVGGQSSLPPALRPPSFQVDSANGYLKMSGNLPQSLANYFIPGAFPGVRILTAQLKIGAKKFADVPLNLRFKLGASPNTFVAAFAPYPDTVDTQQFPSQFAIALMDTVQNVYSVENGGFVLPVELASFAANVDRNNVTLNWTTSSETNNQGFDIERTITGTTEWSKAGTVSGNGTTTEAKSYSFSERLSSGNYTYRLKQIDFNGAINYHALTNEVVVGVPSVYAISQNYPNPFNPTTKIDYELPYDGKVSILLYDISGREVAKLVNEVKTAGYYTAQFNGINLASGMYFYRINAQGGDQNFVSTKKMVLIK
jgi:hypothetical protein